MSEFKAVLMLFITNHSIFKIPTCKSINIQWHFSLRTVINLYFMFFPAVLLELKERLDLIEVQV